MYLKKIKSHKIWRHILANNNNRPIRIVQAKKKYYSQKVKQEITISTKRYAAALSADFTSL